MSPGPGIGVAARVDTHFRRSIETASAFFDTNAGVIAEACRSVAGCFERGGTLLVFGEGAQASDAQHVAVEFVHPVLVGKRALPAIALTSDAGVLTSGGAAAPGATFVSSIASLGSAGDVALALCPAEPGAAITAALAAARSRGLLTLLLSGGAGPDGAADVTLRVAERNPLLVQEVHETAYHVLWELVHLFFDDDAGMHPYLETRTDDRLAHACESTRLKCRDICELREEVRLRDAGRIARTAGAIAARAAAGGRLLACGNGGSATDAQDAAADCMAPAVPGWRTIPALALTNDVGVVTAVANDVGFDQVFARQIAAFGRPGDIALGISTSGSSRSIVEALRGARARGLLTIALAGYDGGAMADPDVADVCFVAPCEYVPRIQEAHATIWHALLQGAQAELR
jgi:D-sedoheptulose 7-phosphate isomerase